MKSRIPELIRFRFNEGKKILRKIYWIFLGLNIKKGTQIGRISCDWPSKVSIGEDCTISDNANFWLKYPFKDENQIIIGDRSFIGISCVFNCDSKIIIGKDCLIANNVTIVDINHKTNKLSTMNSQECFAKEINIENDVWIGSGSTILLGVTIGTGSIIGAGSVVNKSIPENQIWAGVPARFIRHRL